MIYQHLSDGKDATLKDGVLENVKWSETSETSVNVLDNVLGITDVVETSTSQVTLPEVKVPEEADNDYEYQRRNFYQLVERGQDAIDGILELAKESEHPRSYEVWSID